MNSLWKSLVLILFMMIGISMAGFGPQHAYAADPDCSKVENKLTEFCQKLQSPKGLNTQNLDPCDIKISDNCTSTNRNLFTLITNVLNTLFFILGFVAVILIIFEGVLLIVENKEDRRKKIIATIINIALGFGTIILSYAIVSFIVSFVLAQNDTDRTNLTALNAGQSTGQNTTPAYVDSTGNLYSSSLYKVQNAGYIVRDASTGEALSSTLKNNATFGFVQEPKATLDIDIDDGNYLYVNTTDAVSRLLEIQHKITRGATGEQLALFNKTKQSGKFRLELAVNTSETLLDEITVTAANGNKSVISLNKITISNMAGVQTTPGDGIATPPNTTGTNTTNLSNTTTGSTTTNGVPSGSLALSYYGLGDVEYAIKTDATPQRDIGKYVADSIIPLSDGENDVKVLMTINDEKNYARTFIDTKKIEHKILKSTGEIVGTTSSLATERDTVLKFTVAKGSTTTLVDQISAIGDGGAARIISTNRLFLSNSVLPRVGDTATSVDATQRLLVDATYSTLSANKTPQPATVRLLSTQSLYVPLIDTTVPAKFSIDPKLYGAVKPSFLRIETKDSAQKQIEMKELRKELMATGDKEESINGMKPQILTEKPTFSFPSPGVYTMRIDWLDEASNTSISTFTTTINVYGDKTQVVVAPHVSKLGSTFRIDTYPQFGDDPLLQKKTIDLIYLGKDGTSAQNEYTKDLFTADGNSLDYAFLKAGYYTVRLSALYQGAAKATVVEDRVLVYPLSPVIDFSLNGRAGNPAIYDIETSTKYVLPESLTYTLSPTDGSVAIEKGTTSDAVLTFSKAGTYKVTVSGRNDFGQIESTTKSVRIDSLLAYDIHFLGAQKEMVPDNAGIIFQAGQSFTAQVKGRSIEKISMSLPGVNQSIPNMDGPVIEGGSQTFQKDFKFNQSGYFVLQFSIYETGKTTPIQVSKSIYIKDDSHPAAAFDISVVSNAGNISLTPIQNLCKVGGGYVEGYLVRKNKDYILDGSYSLKNNGLPVDGSNTFTWNIDGDTSFSSQAKQTIQFKNLSLLSESCQQMQLTVVDKGVASTLTKYVRVQNSLPAYSSFTVEKPYGLLTSPVTVKATFDNLSDPDRSGLPRIRWFYLVQGKEMQSEVSQDASSRNITIMPYGSSGATFMYQIGAQIFDTDLVSAAATDTQKSYTIYSEPFFVQTPQVAEPSIRISSPRGSDGGKTIPWVLSSPVTFNAQSILMTGDPVSPEAKYVWKVEKTSAPLTTCTDTQSETPKTITDSGLNLTFTFASCGVYTVSVSIDDKGKTATDGVVMMVKKVISDLTPSEQAVITLYTNTNTNSTSTTANTNTNNSSSNTNSAPILTPLITGGGSTTTSLPYTQFNTNQNGTITASNGYIPGTTSNPNTNMVVAQILNSNTNVEEELPLMQPSYTLPGNVTVTTTNPNTSSTQAAYANQDSTVKASAPSTTDVEEIKKLIQSMTLGTATNASAPQLSSSVSGYNIVGPTSLVGCKTTVLVLSANAEARLACNDYNLYSSDASVLADYLKRKDETLYNEQFKALFDALNTQTTSDARLDTFEQIVKKINTSTLSEDDKTQLQKIASLISVAPVDKTLENKMVVDAVDNLKAGLINALTDSEKTGNTLLSQYFNELAGLKNSTVSVDLKSNKTEEVLRNIMSSSLIPESTKQQISSDVTTSTSDLVTRVSELIRNTTTLSDSERKDLLDRLNSLQTSYASDDPITRAKKVQDAILSLLNQQNIGSDVKTLITKEVNTTISQISDKTSERIGETFKQVEGQGGTISKNLDTALKTNSGLSNTLNVLKDLQNSITNASWIPSADKTKIESSVTSGLGAWLQEMKRSIEGSTVLSSSEKDAYYKDIDALLAAKDSRVLIPQLEKQLSVWINDKRLTSDPDLYEKIISTLSTQADTVLKNTRSIVNAVPITSSTDLGQRAALVTQIDQKRQAIFPSSSILNQVNDARTSLSTVSELADKSKEVDAKIVNTLSGSVGEIEAIFDAEGGAIFKPYVEKYKKALSEAATSPDAAVKSLAALNDLYTVMLKQDGRYTALKAKLGGYVESFARTTHSDIDRVTKTSNTASFAAEKKIVLDTINRIKNNKMTVQEAAHELDTLKKTILASEKLPLSVKLEMITALENDPIFQDYFKALRECTAVYVRGKDGGLQRMCAEELKNNPELKLVPSSELFSAMQSGKEAMMSSIDTIVKDPELKKALNILLERLVTDPTLTMDKRLKNARLLLSLLEHPSLTNEKRAALLSKLYAIPVLGDEIKLIQENDLTIQSAHGAAPRELDEILKNILAYTRPLATTERSVIREMLLQIKNFYGKKPDRVDAAVSLTSRLVTDSTLPSEAQKKTQEALIGLGRTDLSIDYGATRPEITLDKLSHELDALQGRAIYAPAKAGFDTLLKATADKDFLAAQGASAKLQDMIQKSSELNEPEKTPIVLDTGVTRDFYTYVAAKIAPESLNTNQNQAPAEVVATPVSTEPSGFMTVLTGIGKFLLGVIVFILLLGVGFYISFLIYKGRHPDEPVDFEEYILNIRESVKKFIAGFRKGNLEEDVLTDTSEESLPRLPKNMTEHEEPAVNAEVVESSVPMATPEPTEDRHHDDNVVVPMDGATPSWLQMTPQVESTPSAVEAPVISEPTDITPFSSPSIPPSEEVASTPPSFFDPFAEMPFSPTPAPSVPEARGVDTSIEDPFATSSVPNVEPVVENTPIFDPFAEMDMAPIAPETIGSETVEPSVENPVQERENPTVEVPTQTPPRATPQRPYIPRNLQTAEQQLQSRGSRSNMKGALPRKPLAANPQKQPPKNPSSNTI